VNEREVDHVIIGDLAFQRIITPKGERDEIAGSAYYCAIAASTISDNGTVGVIARVGEGFNLNSLMTRGINVEGVSVIPNGRTATFTLIEHDGRRDFEAELGVAATVDTSLYPDSYKNATHIHLASAEPKKQIEWIDYLRRTVPSATISADAFEKYALESPEETYTALQSSDLAFLNEEEFALLTERKKQLALNVPFILKRGQKGAEYSDNQTTLKVAAPKVEVVDTTGAGETLAMAYLLLRHKGVSVENALKQAVNLASQEITQFGIDHLKPL
jgi:sugar/nucleoside kinase (ribokinase family)